jgi:hypothetical protein
MLKRQSRCGGVANDIVPSSPDLNLDVYLAYDSHGYFSMFVTHRVDMSYLPLMTATERRCLLPTVFELSLHVVDIHDASHVLDGLRWYKHMKSKQRWEGSENVCRTG